MAGIGFQTLGSHRRGPQDALQFGVDDPLYDSNTFDLMTDGPYGPSGLWPQSGAQQHTGYPSPNFNRLRPGLPYVPGSGEPFHFQTSSSESIPSNAFSRASEREPLTYDEFSIAADPTGLSYRYPLSHPSSSEDSFTTALRNSRPGGGDSGALDASSRSGLTGYPNSRGDGLDKYLEGVGGGFPLHEPGQITPPRYDFEGDHNDLEFPSNHPGSSRPDFPWDLPPHISEPAPSLMFRPTVPHKQNRSLGSGKRYSEQRSAFWLAASLIPFGSLPDDPPNLLSCEPCNQTFKYPKDLRRHLNTATHRRRAITESRTNHSLPASGPYTLPCPLPDCGSEFNRKDNFGRHLRKAHHYSDYDVRDATRGMR